MQKLPIALALASAVITAMPYSSTDFAQRKGYLNLLFFED